MCVNDLFQFFAVTVYAVPDCFSCRHGKLSYPVLCQHILIVRSMLCLGWTSRQQFEETWAALLGVISSPPLPDTVSTEVCNKIVLLVKPLSSLSHRCR